MTYNYYQDFPPTAEELFTPYWNVGLPAIPLSPLSKRPFETDWTRWCHTMPDAEQQQRWISKINSHRGDAPYNIGLPAGGQSNLVFLDIDTDDEDIINYILTVLPQSPWKRRGKKGFVLAYKFTPNFARKKAFFLESQLPEDKKPFLELLSTGNQVVLPPSIHPETLRPYTSNVNLYDIQHFPPLPDNLFEQLRKVLPVRAPHSSRNLILTDYVPAGARDSKMVSMAGLLASDIFRGSLSLNQALERLTTWHDSLVQKVVGDPLDINKGREKLIEFIVKDCENPVKPRILPVGWDLDLDPNIKMNLLSLLNEEFIECDYVTLQQKIIHQFAPLYQADEGQLEDINFNGTSNVMVILKEIIHSPSLTKLETNSLMHLISTYTTKPLNVSLATIKLQHRELIKGALTGESHTEIAQQVLIDYEKLNPVAFANGFMYQWQGSHWEILSEQSILKYVAEQYGHYNAAKKEGDHRGIYRVMTKLTSQEIKTGISTGINFANCYLKVETNGVNASLVILPHSPEYGETSTLPFCYSEEQNDLHYCSNFYNFLEDCWGRDPDFTDKVLALQEMLAAALFGVATDYQRAFLLYGVASSGKTTLLNIIKQLFSEKSISVIPPEKWGERFTTRFLAGKRINICGELSDKQRIDGKSFKEIVDGTEVTAEIKGGDVFNLKPTASHWFGSNHLPKTSDVSEGFNRRFLILSFNRVISDFQKVINMDKYIIAQEREAIVAWAVEGMKRLIDNKGYTLPSSHKVCVQEMASQNSSTRFFYYASEIITLPKMVLKGCLRTQVLVSDLIPHLSELTASALTLPPDAMVSVERILPLIIPNGIYTPHYYNLLSFLWNTENKASESTLKRLKEDYNMINIYTSLGQLYTGKILTQEKFYQKLVSKLTSGDSVNERLFMNMVWNGFTLISESLILEYSRNLLRDHGVALGASPKDFIKDWSMMLSDLGIILITEDRRNFLVETLRSLKVKPEVIAYLNSPSNRFYMGCTLANKRMEGSLNSAPITSYPLF